MSLPLDGRGGLLLGAGIAVLLLLIVLTAIRRRRGRRPFNKGAAVAAGWYADPAEPQTMRFWNGARWTDSPAD